MNLREILNEDIIDLEVDGTTKDEVLHNMATLLLKSPYLHMKGKNYNYLLVI